ETGLPSGTIWYVNITGGASYSSTTSTITFNEPNGSYSYTVATGNKEYAPKPSSGSFTVNGANVNQAITFTFTYRVTFTESGLPSGTIWYVNITGGASYSSTTSTITFNEPNGSYSYTVATGNKEYAPSLAKGSFAVNGGNVNQAVTFNLVTYSVTFTETGLPSGTIWYVNITGGASYSSTTSTITFNEPNGSYSYTVATGNKKYAPSLAKGSFAVNGGNVNQAVTFNLVTYSVTFTETGLPSGTIWYVNITGGASYSSTTSTITFNEPNGTYSYTVATGNKEYAPGLAAGSLTVNGAPVSESITFNLFTYSVTFTESGLSTGVNWSVTLNGVTEHSTSTSIVFTEPNGTYAYSTGYVTESTTSFASGNVTVNGKAVTQKIIFSSTSTSSTSTNTLSITSAYLYSIIIAIIIVAVVIVTIMLMKKRGKQSGANVSANNATYTQGTTQNEMGGGGQFPPQPPPVQPPMPSNQ
ncbi:MAG: hypothetical protein M1411_00980, partial [Candidatus Thermoplasmatota archaeon]|nr:hypothetical protein [Candidatus Thermoplasmatota archaeon]